MRCGRVHGDDVNGGVRLGVIGEHVQHAEVSEQRRPVGACFDRHPQALPDGHERARPTSSTSVNGLDDAVWRLPASPPNNLFTALTSQPARTGTPVNDVLYAAHTGNRHVQLPGLTARARAGPQPGDIVLPGGLYIASRERGLAENTLPTRSRGSRIRRTFDEAELGDWVDEIAHRDPDKLADIRERAETLGPALGVTDDNARVVARQIGAAIGTQQIRTGSAVLTARQTRAPYDQERIARSDDLGEALRRSSPRHHPVDQRNRPRPRVLPVLRGVLLELHRTNRVRGRRRSRHRV